MVDMAVTVDTDVDPGVTIGVDTELDGTVVIVVPVVSSFIILYIYISLLLHVCCMYCIP